MPSLNEMIRTGDICKNLRSKKLCYETEETASDISSAGPFWCSRTQSLIGPDGRFAGAVSCCASAEISPARSCCETT